MPTKHTPGPWRLAIGHSTHRPLITNNETDVTKIMVLAEARNMDSRLTREIVEANAALIASSPDILARLYEARNVVKALLRAIETETTDKLDDRLWIDWQRETAETLYKAEGDK